jgi:hypothetical protein
MLRRALLLTAGLFLLLPLYASFAQDAGDETPTLTPSPTPEAGVIVRHGYELIFPVELEFSLIVSVPPSDIQSGEVILSQDSGFQQTIPLNLDTDINLANADSLEIRKAIRFELNNAPRPFERLDYEWRLNSVRGTDNLERWLLFQPDDVEWQHTPADALRMYWHDDNLAANILREELQPAIDQIASHTGTSPSLDFAIYSPDFEICVPDEEDESTLVYPGHPQYSCSLDDLRDYYGNHGIAFIQPPDSGFDTLQNEMIEVMVIQAYAPGWVGRGVPVWFAEGLAQLYRQNINVGAVEIARSAEAQDMLLPPSRLENLLPDDADAFDQRLWDAQSYTLLLYLADTFGEDAPIDLATAFPEAESFDVALQNITGMTLAENFRLWRQWLRSDEADN